MLKKPLSLAGSVPRDYDEATFWALFDETEFTPPALGPSAPGIHGWGLVREGDAWIWHQGAAYALFVVRIDVVRISQAWVKAQLALQMAAYREANDVERVPRSVIADLREALVEDAARRATPEPKLFHVLIRFDSVEPDADGRQPVTIWCDSAPGALDAQFRRALTFLGVQPGNERGIGDGDDVLEDALPDVGFEQKLVDRIRHAELVAGDASFVLGDEVKFTTATGSVAIKGHAEGVLDRCLEDQEHRLSLLSLTARFGEDAINLKYEYPTYYLRGWSMPDGVIPDYGDVGERVVARIELLESLTRSFREAARDAVREG